MKGEERLDLNQLLKAYPKCELLVADFFKVSDFNEINFRDLYDFFDAQDYHPFVERIQHNESGYWISNVVDPVTESPRLKQEEFENRKDAEFHAIKHSFYHLENILTPPSREYHNYDTSTNSSFLDLPF